MNPPTQRSQPSPFVYPPLTPPGSAPLDAAITGPREQEARESVLSTSQISNSARKAPKGRLAYNPTRQSVAPSSTPSHHRAGSLDEQQISNNKAKEGIFKIVIDRSNSRKSETPKMTSLPSLEVPIPTYKLGTPRFSTFGTATIRSSSYTRTSVSDYRTSILTRPDYDRLFPSPPGQLHPLHDHDTLLRPRYVTRQTPSGVTRSSAALPSPKTYSVNEAIEPNMFDRLAAWMNDPSVVRYSPKTGEITAATPARIIAQISSDSFMDYELVSDFFLTYRAYLKPDTLLSLLLARLGWAISRMSEDGRIIRIRTFAALRHWILNYFADDFLVDRPLRETFCNRINNMFYTVKHRNSGGKSDLKILLDLKRCWNGRCALYWDSPEFVVDGPPESSIIPGGVIGNRDSQLTQIPPPLSPSRLSHPRNGMHERRVPGKEPGAPVPPIPSETHGHVREISAGTIESNFPASPTSDLSIQALSCSIPKRGKTGDPGAKPVKEPHPVPATAFAMQPAHAHKRSASSSDSARGQMHIDLVEKSTQLDASLLQGGGSMIRGNVYAPSSPFVDVIASNIPAAPSIATNQAYNLTEASLRPGTAVNPGMKSILGSIRKALSSKHSVSTAPSRSADTAPSVPSLRGQTSTLPLNVALEDGTLREKKVANVRHQLRIDLLCAEVLQSYQDIVSRRMENDPSVEQDIGIALGNPSQEDEVISMSPSSGQQQRMENRESARVLSGITTGSRSIVIINDINDANDTIPAMSGALPQTTYLAPPRHIPEAENGKAFTKVSGFLRRPSDHSVANRSSGIFGNRRSRSAGPDLSRTGAQARAGHRETASFRSSSVGRNRLEYSAESASSTPDVQNSLQSSTAQNELNGTSTDPTECQTSTAGSATDETEKAPSRLLRRRPGGDLRKHQNVHDLEPIVNRDSMRSIATATDSLGGSVLVMANKIAPPPAQLVSLIKTHSSARMRPSFEAAVAGFASIPDDPDTGIESTLLKLEGRYEPGRPDTASGDPLQPAVEKHVDLAPEVQVLEVTSRSRNPSFETQVSRRTGDQATFDQALNVAADTLHQSFVRSRTRSEIFGLPTDLDTGSEDSYGSTPLLERGISDAYTVSANSASRSVSVPRPLFSRSNTADTQKPAAESSHPSIEVIDETESMKRIPKGSTLPEKSPTNESFLLDENEELSDLSSELSDDDFEDADNIARSISSVMAPGVPLHPLAHPPSPPQTQPILMQNPPPHVPAYPKNPPTPDPSPKMRSAPFVDQSKTDFGPTLNDSHKTLRKEIPSSGHIPFILACDSEMLAQQFTLVEKAALTEIDWNDLVEMRWDNSAHNVLNWVNLVSMPDVKGIDLVIGRFNLMVKWVVSQIVLTQSMHERARTITKYIRIAAHARRLHNYATMLQITIALTSIDVARLSQTWELVKYYEKQLLREMEVLTQPVKNYQALRGEMEGRDLEDGCVPFVGTYLQLHFHNSQCLCVQGCTSTT